MRVKTVLRTTAVLGLAALAGLLGASGTWALWSTSTPTQAATIQSADWAVEVNGAAWASGVIATAEPEAGGAPLTPATPVYSALTITNVTDASGPFDLRVVVGTVPTNQATSTLAAQVMVRVAANPRRDECSALQYVEGDISRDITKNQPADFCLEFSLPHDAPVSLANTTDQVIVPVSATQIPPTAP